jgi:hypothetical protein
LGPARSRRSPAANAASRIGPSWRSAEDRKARGRNRVTGNHSVRSRPLAPPQHHPRIAIAGDVPQRAASRCRTLHPTEGLRTHIKKKKPRRRQRGSASPRIFSLAGVVPPVRRIPTVARRVIWRRRIIARERADTRSRMGSSPDYNVGSMLQLRPMRALASAPARRLALGWARTHFLKSPLMRVSVASTGR